MADIRAHLADLDAKYAQALSERTHQEPRHTIALQRQELLQEFTQHRHTGFHADFNANEGQGALWVENFGDMVLRKDMWTETAAKLLGIPENELPMAVDVDFVEQFTGKSNPSGTDSPEIAGYETVTTPHP
jgi:hypothetical protein